MMTPETGSRERLLDVLTWLLVLPVLLISFSNPDLFWHLETAQRMLADGALPRSDALSSTMLGAPWVDFEWLVQLIFYGFFKAGGWAGLLILKAVLLLCAGALVWSLGELTGAGKAWRRCILLFWAALTVIRSELKPELFSVILFSVELWVLEARRLGVLPGQRVRVWALVSALFFAFWANLHPGFPAGLALLACYGLGRDGWKPVLAALLAGAAGTFLNPYGFKLHAIMLEHARWLPVMSRYIMEWRPPLAANIYQWPLWLLFPAVPLALGTRIRVTRTVPWPHAAAAVLLGVPALFYSRQAAFFIPVGLLLLLESGARVAEARPALLAPLRRWAAPLWALACVAFIGWMTVPDLRRRRAFDDRIFPAAAADFIEREMGAFRRKRCYNEWGWGGYLAFRFRADLRVFMDGRYLFHPLLAEVVEANSSPETWLKLLDRYGVEWALMANQPRRIKASVPALALTSGRRETEVPHFAAYMPSSEWTLVYRDPVALIFIRRGAFPRDWVGRRRLTLGPGTP
ncbi:MAG: hypothetical protein A2X36_02725 [Elusimicrobia bacterium GWA2_69_24]|nr:MAG: hypothetical protein A2X36_02725 [Elusimicrobia bacterium GWA2_69_24]HBL19052.1 hypothetical protein [Elusimicrobiota bacterium]